jgi:hypothetical protein
LFADREVVRTGARVEELLGKSAAQGKSGGKLIAEDYAACRAAA